MTTKAQVKLVVDLAVLPGKASAQREHFAWLQPQVLAEAGCYEYDLYQVEGSDTDFVILETWEDEASLAAHAASEHMKIAAEKAKPFRAGAAKIRRITPV